MIDRIFQTVKTYVNTDGHGNFTPKKFNTILHNKVLEHFENLFFEANQMVNRQNRGLLNGGIENITEKVRERIQHYIVPETTLTYSAPYFILPTDLHYFDVVLYNNEIIDLCKSTKEFKIVETANPTEDYPIGLKQGQRLSVRPSTIVDTVTMSYLRKPIEAKWTYQLVLDVEQFNPSASDFVNVDIHPSQEVDITLSVLEGFGVELKEKDLVAFSQREQVTAFNQEKSS